MALHRRKAPCETHEIFAGIALIPSSLSHCSGSNQLCGVLISSRVARVQFEGDDSDGRGYMPSCIRWRIYRIRCDPTSAKDRVNYPSQSRSRVYLLPEPQRPDANHPFTTLNESLETCEHFPSLVLQGKYTVLYTIHPTVPC